MRGRHKDTIKSEILPLLLVASRGYVSTKQLGGRHSMHHLQVENWPLKAALLLRFHSAVSVGRGQHAWQLLALSIVSVCGFSAVAHLWVCDINTFVWFLVRILTS